jgi:hypothetical protein
MWNIYPEFYTNAPKTVSLNIYDRSGKPWSQILVFRTGAPDQDDSLIPKSKYETQSFLSI